MGCGGSKQGVVPLYDDLHARNGSEQAPSRTDASGPGTGGNKTVRLLAAGASPSKRHVDRKENQSFFDKSRSVKGSRPKSAGAKSQKRVAAFTSRKATRLDAPPEPECKKPANAGGKSRFARSIMAVTDAMFGPPPEWILRQTSPIKSQYQFLGVVGRGQFGQVYCIRHVKHNVKFACKTLGKKKLLSQLDADDIKREIEVMHHLSGHALVVGLHQVFEDEKNVHLVMDLCQGDLYELLRECKYLPEVKAAPLMMLAIRAVQYCHAMGVVHRDIKPENFLLASRNDLSHIKLTDFGLSTFYQEGQVFNELLGSPYYIAPEVIRQKYGKEADVWSCGVMLYIMLCGEAPFFGEGDEGIFKSIMKAKLDFSFEPWPSLSKDVKMLLRRMLVKDPRERATLEEVLAHPWFARYVPQADSLKAGGGWGGGGEPAPQQPVARTGAPAATLPPLPGSPGRPPCGGAGCENPLFSRIKRYSVASRTKKAALRYIVASLPDEVTAGLFNLFQDFDADDNHAIDVHEFKSGFMRRGVALLDEEAGSLVHSADLDGDGVLNLVEWLGATMYIPEEQVESLVSEAFAFMDTDRNGFLTASELLDYLGEGQSELAELIMAEADTDMDGRVSAEEFRAAYSMTMDRSRAASRPGTAPGEGGVSGAGGRLAGAAGGKGGAVAVGEAGGDGGVAGPSGACMVRMTSVTSVVSMGMGDELTRNSSLVLLAARSELRVEED
ncbi:Calcium-dependent protein kinase 13 [Pleodorina starrii]|uniref:Calcium-dependent protein kinase 13 n=1 Tax=Pleodorina starrii TaxID=330485 RepID=A0A9W6FA86_9CHLO|nr:Calcium-dependent protein kinase 13 [Pleodorina starrii]GLC62053.1 Calcium-dependent protein kinase 13 [Pleodorina starrii]GLC65643.1 Calcium-dependent protein kinase 13 [Pleodorina starrii]